MRIVHISDTHGAEFHGNITTPDCDILIHSGDTGFMETTMKEVAEFLIWFEAQPAKKKIWVPGNHDVLLDKDYIKRKGKDEPILRLVLEQHYMDIQQLIPNYDIVYLNNKDHVHNGVKFYGSPFSPSFHRDRWAFNADPGEEIMKQWSRIPSDTEVLITHSPPYGILDLVDEKYRKEGDIEGPMFKGCKDLVAVIKKRLTKLKLHCFGHIHDNYGVVKKPVSNSRHILFSNGAAITNGGKQLYTKPLIIDL